MRVLRWSGVLVAVLALAQATFAAGMLIPKDRDVPPLAIKSHRVSVTISDQVAVTKVEQVFENSTSRDLEATYIFPVPKGASISDFALYIGGKRVPGELLPREKAREIYTDIVRRMRDPALLEYMDSQLFQVKVYPVPANGRQKLELQFTQLLPREGELSCYEYPLKTTGEAARTLEDFSVAVDLTAKETLTNIYSPTHNVGVTRKDDHHAVIGFEQDRALLDRDFVLYYAVSAKDLGLNLITYRPDPQKPGYFMMLISPREEMSEEKVLPRDMTFVFDTSGSMQGEKIQQARAALRYCVQGLKPEDRFNIIAFSTTTDPFQDGLVEASDKNVKAALSYIDKLEARGGTDINSALTQALAVKGSEERPATILFMTDGRPTVGVTEPEEILKNVRGANKAETRIFVFGVGDDVNTHLLDRVSGENKGLSDYVRPNEDIEVKVSSLFNKIRKPVLADVKLAVDKVTIRDCYPTELGDLFAGTELTLLGRYDKPGDALIRLTGTARAEKKSFDYEGTFAEKDVEHQFVAHLWATRKIGYLLDQVRLHGESKELRDEVVALSTEFGIPTPYTSYLALPDAERGRYLPTTVLRSRGGDITGLPAPATAAPAAPSTSFSEARRQREAGAAPGAMAGGGGGGGRAAAVDEQIRTYRDHYLANQTGAEAVEAAKDIAELKRAERPTGLAVKKVGERTFEYWSGFWVDRAYKTDMPTVEVKYLSDAYFKVLAAAPELKDVFALGDRVVVVLKGKALVIQAEGKQDMSDKDVADLLGR
jgi:Ca-activated chloride channel family protein